MQTTANPTFNASSNGTNGSNGTSWSYEDFDFLKEKGFDESRKSGGDPRIFEAILASFHDRDEEAGNLRREIFHLNAQTRDYEGRIAGLKDVTGGLREQIATFEREKERMADEKEEEIAEKRVEIRRIRSGDYSLLATDTDPANRLAYFLGSVIILLLSVYLVIFYISVIYNAFLLDPIKYAISSAEGDFSFSVTIANVRAIWDTYDEYGVLGAVFLITGAFMFIALGFLVHWFIQNRRVLWMAGLYAFAFFFDGFLAYEIVKKIHIVNNFQSEEWVEWQWTMAFQSSEFYLILFAGFGMYVIWGLLLQYLLMEHYKIQPARAGIGKRKAEIKRLKAEIAELKNRFDQQINGIRKEIRDIEQREIGHLQSEIQHFGKKLKTLRERLSQNLKKNHVPTHVLQGKCSAYFTGWGQAILNTGHSEQNEQRLKECKGTLDQFYNLLDVH